MCAGRVAMAASAGALVLAIAVSVVPIRFQYYLDVVADMQRRGDAAQVLAAYEKAEQYAPSGQSRRQQIEALRSRLAATRVRRLDVTSRVEARARRSKGV